MKKVLITGANGDIGSQIVSFLEAKNIDTIKLVRNNSTEQITDKVIQENSIFNINKLNVLINQATDVVHLAAVLNKTYLDKTDLANMLCINSLLTGLITKISIDKYNDEKRLIYVSSEMIYLLEDSLINTWISKAVIDFEDFLENVLCVEENYNNAYMIAQNFCVKYIEENPIPKGCNFYALTKLLAEKFVLKSDNFVILRLTNIYGPGYLKDRKIPRLIKAKLFGQCINEENDLRDYVYVDDINEIILKLIENSNYTVCGIFDLASNNRIYTSDVLEIINKSLPTQYGEVVLKRNQSNPPLKKQFNENIIDKLNIIPKNIVIGIQDTIKFFQATIDYSKKMNSDLTAADVVDDDEKIIKMLKGGSSSCTMIIQDDRGYKFVRKAAFREGVEGNGIPKLRKEIEYLKHIVKDELELHQYYPTLKKIKLSDKVVYYDMAFIGNGSNMFVALKEKLSSDLFFSVFKKFIDGIINDGYMKKMIVLDKKESHEIFESLMINRALGRLQNLFNYYNNEKSKDEVFGENCKLSKSLILKLQSKYYIINGQTYQSPTIILNKIRENPYLVTLFLPKIKSMCVHGDLTLMNMVWDDENKEIKLIDPRGLIGELDPLYDFGKIKFSLSGFSSIMEGCYDISLDKSSNFVFKINHDEDIKTKIEKVNFKYIKILSESESFKNLISHDLYWEKRILFYEALHYFADIPFRLYTDGNPRNAIACFLRGTVLLNDLYNTVIEDKKINVTASKY